MKTADNVSILGKNRVENIKIDSICVNSAQPRENFKESSLISLSESIRENGLLQPLTVRKSGKGYELIAGERRLRALKLLERKTAPCIVVNVDEERSAVLAIIENIQRENLNIFEEARAIQALIEKWGVSQSEAAKRLSLSQSAVANKLRILKLSQREQNIILEKGLCERHARALLKISDLEMRQYALLYIAKHSLNVTESEKYIEKLLSKKKSGSQKFVFRDLRIFVNTINKAIDTMRASGIRASATKDENDGYIEYVIRIPKPCAAPK